MACHLMLLLRRQQLLPRTFHPFSHLSSRPFSHLSSRPFSRLFSRHFFHLIFHLSSRRFSHLIFLRFSHLSSRRFSHRFSRLFSRRFSHRFFHLISRPAFKSIATAEQADKNQTASNLRVLGLWYESRPNSRKSMENQAWTLRR